MAEFAVPPVMPVLRQHFHSSDALDSLLMGAFALAAMASALAAGRLANRWGVNRVALGGLMGLALGMALGWASFSGDTMAGFLAARLLAGCGFGLISVAAPAKISQQVEGAKMARALAIWATWVPVGSLIMFLLGPHLVGPAHILPLTVAEWGMEGLAAVLLVQTSNPRPSARLSPEAASTPWVLPMIFVAGAFAFFTAQQFALSTWLSTWLTRDFFVTLSTSGLVGAAASVVGALGNLAGGPFVGARPKVWPFLASGTVMTGLWLLLGVRALALAIVFTLLLNLVGGLIPTVVFAAPRLVSEHDGTVAPAMAFVIVGENLGIVVGPLLFSIMMAGNHFARGFQGLAILGAAMTLALALFFRQTRRLGQLGGRSA
nr:MFS transporter [Sulfobacillus harzensis]